MKLNLSHLAGAALLYFGAVLWLALGHYEAKFIMDGFSHVFTISNSETFSSSLGRYVLLIQQVVPVLFAKAGADIRTIMLAYVIWDVVFYFLCFLFTLFVLKDALASLLLVSVHSFGIYYNHFMMVGELLPGAMFAIITLSTIRNWGALDGWKWSVTTIAAFFTVSSHPLALVSLVVASVILRSGESMGERGIRWPGLLVLLVLMMALKLLLLDDYDENTIYNTVRGPAETVMALLAPSYLFDYLQYYLLSSPVVSVLSVIILLCGIRLQMWLPLGLWAMFVVAWSVVAQQYLDFSFYGLNSVVNMMHDRYLFPMKFATLSFLILIIVPGQWRIGHGAWWSRVIMVLWFAGLPFLYLSSFKAQRTVDEFRTVISWARQEGFHKAHYPVQDYCLDTYIHRGSFYATLILSSIDGGIPCHVVHAPNHLIPKLAGLREDEILLMEGIVKSTDDLDPKRFSLPKAVYERLDYACDRDRLGAE
jgi:hypothetical protein